MCHTQGLIQGTRNGKGRFVHCAPGLVDTWSHKTQLSHAGTTAPPLPLIRIVPSQAPALCIYRIRPRFIITHRGFDCDKESSKASPPCTTARTLLQGLPMISNCFHSKKSSKSVTCKVAQGSVLFQGWWRTWSSAGSQEPAPWDTSSAHSSSERASLPATHIDAILQTQRGKEMKLRPAVFTKNNPHYQQEQKASGEGRENRTVRTECAQVLPEAAPDIKMPSCSLK